MKKIIRYLLRGLAIFAGVLVIVYTIAYIYVVANKKSIIAQIKDQVADKLNGQVQIGNISLGFLAQFPSISVELDQISIKDTLFSQHKHPFFAAEKVYAGISVINLIKKNNPLNSIQIENGQLYIYTDISGYTNSYLLSPKSIPSTAAKKPSTAKTDIESVKLKNVRLILDDRKKGKLYDFEVAKLNWRINTGDSIITFKTSNDILIHSLAFNTDLGSYVHEAQFNGDFKLLFDKNSKRLSFDDIDIKLKGHKFNLSGHFDFSEESSFALNVSSKNIDYAFAKTLLTRIIDSSLSLVKLEKPVNEVKAEISGSLKGGDPLVNINWKVEDNNVTSPYANFTDCSLTGSFTNEMVKGQPRKDPNSRLHFQNFTGNWERLKITSQNVYVDNLALPIVKADIKTDFDLTQLNNLLGSSSLDLHQGKGKLDITYSGPLQANNSRNTLINGKLTFSDGLLMYHPRNMPMTNVSGNIVFKNTDIYVTDFRGNVQGNKIVMNGVGKNLLALLNTSPDKVFLDWSIYSPSLNLGNFTSLLKDRPAPAAVSHAKSKLGNTARNIDEIVSQANFRLSVKADQLTFKRFAATNVKASLALVNENWILNNVSLQHGGGSMVINGDLTAKNNQYYQANIKVNMQNVDVNKVMYAFDNFGQSGISSENLRGKLTSSADVKMDIDRNVGSPSNIDGFVDFSLKNGALLHYEPLQKIQKVAFKKRNFDEIYFAELKDKLDIKNRDIVINRMEIQSTVLTLFVEGIYSLSGKTDISIQIPISNIKKRDEDYTPENKGANAKGGASVFVRGRPGSDGSIQFKLDLFRKFRKKDKAFTDSTADKFTD